MLCILVILFIIDHILILLYCRHQKKKKDVIKTEQNSCQYENKNSRKSAFFMESIRFLLYVYKGWIRYRLILLGKVPSHTYRIWMLKNIFLMDMGPKVVIYGGFEIRAPWKIQIGEGTVIGDECKLDGRNGLKIGSNCNFSTGVWIWTDQHDPNDSMFGTNGAGGPVVIGDRVWISSRSVILPNNSVGEGAVVAAGAIVTKPVKPFCIVGGVPAKEIGQRSHDLRYEFNGEHQAFW